MWCYLAGRSCWLAAYFRRCFNISHNSRDRALFVAQVPARQTNKHVLQACLTRGKVQQLRPPVLERREQRRDSFVRLVDAEYNSAVFLVNALHPGKALPAFNIVMAIFSRAEFEHVM